MLFRQLQYFVVLSRERHFARAAAACYVSQPALSEAIRKLEHELNVPLVKRGHAFDGLTPEGERLLPWAQRILADHDALKQEASVLQSGLTGILRLGVVPAASATAAMLVDPFCALHPRVRVQLETNLPSSDIAQRVHRFELNAGVIYPDGENTAGLTAIPLYEERQVLIAAGELLRDVGESIGWDELTRLPLCLLNPAMHGRKLLDAALATHGLSVEPRIEADSLAALHGHVATGHWAGVVPQPWSHATPTRGGLRTVALREPEVRSQIVLVTNTAQPVPVLDQALRTVAATLRLGELFALDTPNRRG